MPTSTLTPTAEGTDTGWTLSTGSTKTEAVQTNDGATSEIFGSGTADQTFAMSDLPAGAKSIVGSVLIYWVAHNTSPFSATGGGIRCRRGGSATNSADLTGGLTTSYGSATSASFSVDPSTSAAWTVAGVNAMEAGGWADGVVTGQIWVTQFYSEVTFGLASGGFVCTIFDILSPVLGVGLFGSGLTMRDARSIASKVLRVTGGRFRIHEKEYPDLLFDLTRRRAYAFLDS